MEKDYFTKRESNDRLLDVARDYHQADLRLEEKLHYLSTKVNVSLILAIMCMALAICTVILH